MSASIFSPHLLWAPLFASVYVVFACTWSHKNILQTFITRSIHVLYSPYLLLDFQMNKVKNLYCCHQWNVNILITSNLTKISHLEAYNAISKYNFIFMSETHFDSAFLKEDKKYLTQRLQFYQGRPSKSPKKRRSLYLI